MMDQSTTDLLPPTRGVLPPDPPADPARRVAAPAEPLVPAPEPVLRATKGQRIALLVGIFIAALLALTLFSSVLLPFVAASCIAYFLDPLATRLSRAGVPRALAAILLLIALLGAVLLFALLLYPLVMAQFGILLMRIPRYVAMLRDWANDVMTHLQDRLGPNFVNANLRELVASQAGAMLSFVSSAISRLIGGGFALFNVLTLVVVTPIVAFYLLRDWPRMIARLDAWVPRRYAAVVRAQAREVDRILSAWLRGQAVCAVALALFYCVGLTLVGLDLGLIVGLAAGVLSFIPYVGTITGAITSLALAAAQFPTWHGIAAVASVFVLGQLLEGYVIYPRFLGDRVQLHAVWVIFALFAGGAAFGFLGVLLAVPVAATIGVIARYWLRRYLSSPLYLDPPAPRREAEPRA